LAGARRYYKAAFKLLVYRVGVFDASPPRKDW